MTFLGIRKLFISWWYGGNFRSRAKDDYRRIAKLKLEINDPFPRDEDLLFRQIDQGN